MSHTATEIDMVASLHNMVYGLQKKGVDLGLEVTAQGARFYNRALSVERSCRLSLCEAEVWIDGFIRGFTEANGGSLSGTGESPYRGLTPEVRRHIATGTNYLEGLRLIRSITGASLAQAKDIYREIAGRVPWER